MKKHYLLLGFTVFLLFSCQKSNDFITDGYKPIYVDKAHIFDISSSAPVPIINAGKIYLYNSLVFINERGRGVHVINNQNPSSPLKTHFINIPGNYDIAIRNNYLYADNATDLVTIDINDLSNVTVVSRISDVYGLERQMYPDFTTGYFECADTTKGFVVGWTKAELVNPKCRR